MQYVGHIYIEKNDFSPIWYSSSNECPVLLFSESSNHIVLESVLLIQSYPTLWDPVNYSLPGSSVHGVFQARVLEWIAISSSKGSSPPRDLTWVSCLGRWFFTIWDTREASPEILVHVRETNKTPFQTLSELFERKLKWSRISTEWDRTQFCYQKHDSLCPASPIRKCLAKINLHLQFFFPSLYLEA